MPAKTDVNSKDGTLAKPREFKDADWHKKIEIAKEARSSAIRARQGKRAAFADHLVGRRQRG